MLKSLYYPFYVLIKMLSFLQDVVGHYGDYNVIVRLIDENLRKSSFDFLNNFDTKAITEVLKSIGFSDKGAQRVLEVRDYP